MFVGVADVYIESNKRMPESAGAACTAGSHRWQAQGDTGTAPPKSSKDKSQKKKMMTILKV